MNTSNKAPPRRWVVIFTWMFVSSYGFILLQYTGFLLPSMTEDLGLSPSEQGWLGLPRALGSGLGGGLLAIPAAWVFSRFRPKPLTFVCLLIGAGVAFFQGLVPSFPVLVLASVAYAGASIAIQPAGVLLIRQWFPTREVVLVNALGGLVYIIGSVGFIFMPSALYLLNDSWRIIYFASGVASLAMPLVWLVLGRERITPRYDAEMRSQESNPLRAILRYKELWIIGLGQLGAGISFSAHSTFWPSYMLDRYDTSLLATSTAMALGAVFSLIAGIGVAVLVMRVGRKRQILLPIGIILALVSVPQLLTGFYPAQVMFQSVNATGLSIFSIIVIAIPFELPGIKPREIAVALAFLQTTLFIGSSFGPILAGVVQEVTNDLQTGLMVTGFAPVLMTVAAMLLPRRLDLVTADAEPVQACTPTQEDR